MSTPCLYLEAQGVHKVHFVDFIENIVELLVSGWNFGVEFKWLKYTFQ